MLCKKCKQDVPDGSIFCCWCGVRQEPAPRTRPKRANGEGSVYQTPNGKWKAEVSFWRDGIRCRATKAGLKTKREALEAIPALKEAALSEKDKPNDITIAELWEQLQEKWLPTLSKDKASHYRTAWTRLTSISRAKIRGLRYGDLQPLIDALGKQYYPARDVKALLRKMYELALKYEYADKDYAAMLELPPMKAGSRRALTLEEIQRMWADYEAGHEATGYFLIMAYTGMRSGELLTIKTANVDLAQQVCTGGIKTEAGKKRQIVFCDKIMPLVDKACKQGTERLCSLPEDAFYYEWKQLCRRISLKDADPYCLRHTAASLLAAEGAEPVIIQQLLGHKSYAVTAENYTHIPLEDKLNAVNKLK